MIQPIGDVSVGSIAPQTLRSIEACHRTGSVHCSRGARQPCERRNSARRNHNSVNRVLICVVQPEKYLTLGQNERTTSYAEMKSGRKKQFLIDRSRLFERSSLRYFDQPSRLKSPALGANPSSNHRLFTDERK